MVKTRKTIVKGVSVSGRHPLTETPRQRFLRIGQGRMVNALHAIRLLGNLAGPGYEWGPNDIVLLHSTITEAVEEAFAKFQRAGAGPKLEETFDLKSLTSHHSPGTVPHDED